MGYYIDLDKIDIDQLKYKLVTADLIPSRMLLKDDIESIFDTIRSEGIKNTADLLRAINSKNKIETFSSKTNLSRDYLTVLAREIKSDIQKPNLLKNFPEITKKTAEKLSKMDITNTLLYDKILTAKSRNELAEQTNIELNEIEKLAKLTDLSRIRWVNHTFAFVLYESGYDTLKKVVKANSLELYEALKRLNEDENIYRGHIGLHDMKLCIESAKELSMEMEL